MLWGLRLKPAIVLLLLSKLHFVGHFAAADKVELILSSKSTIAGFKRRPHSISKKIDTLLFGRISH